MTRWSFRRGRSHQSAHHPDVAEPQEPEAVRRVGNRRRSCKPVLLGVRVREGACQMLFRQLRLGTARRPRGSAWVRPPGGVLPPSSAGRRAPARHSRRSHRSGHVHHRVAVGADEVGAGAARLRPDCAASRATTAPPTGRGRPRPSAVTNEWNHRTTSRTSRPPSCAGVLDKPANSRLALVGGLRTARPGWRGRGLTVSRTPRPGRSPSRTRRPAVRLRRAIPRDPTPSPARSPPPLRASPDPESNRSRRSPPQRYA
jgi:hypothetical protein